MTNVEREIIRHSLGLSSPYCKGGKPYRNHYCARDGTEPLEAMVAAGLMERGSALNEGRDRYYHVTEAGAAAVGSKLPKE